MYLAAEAVLLAILKISLIHRIILPHDATDTLRQVRARAKLSDVHALLFIVHFHELLGGRYWIVV